MNDERIQRIRQLAELVFADARTLDDVDAASEAIEIELMHASLHRSDAIRQHDASTLSTERECSSQDCDCEHAADATRSGALEPEEITDGPNRRGG